MRRIQRGGACRNVRQHSLERHAGRLADHEVKRLGADILLDQVGPAVGDAGRERRDHDRMHETGLDKAGQRIGQRADMLWREIEIEGLDSDRPVAVRIARPVDGTPDANSNLVNDGEWTECTRSSAWTGASAVQLRYSLPSRLMDASTEGASRPKTACNGCRRSGSTLPQPSIGLTARLAASLAGEPTAIRFRIPRPTDRA